MWREIFQSIIAHKQRSVLTGLGITWGIFILIILLGLGNGFEKGVMKLFDGFNRNTVWVFCGQTSQPYKGLQAGRNILLKYDDISLLKSSVTDIDNISPELTNWGGSLISYKNNFVRLNIKGVCPDYFKIKLLNTSEGRLINYLDNKEKRRVVVLGKYVADQLFKKSTAVGKYVNIDNTYYLVIGVTKSGILAFPGEEREVYIPYYAFSETYTGATAISIFLYSTKYGSDDKQTEKKIKRVLSGKYQFNQNDDKALFFNNIDEQVKAFDKLFTGVKYFLWIMGISTLLSGVIGVGNIMFVIVKERTKEIGVRKAIGAKPYIIKIMILSEAVIFTLLAGVVGMALGFTVLELINMYLKNMDLVITETTLDLTTIIAALIVLIISGTLAGMIPANKAANVSPIIALKDE
jgi:putative ABC transport system permease protein